MEQIYKRTVSSGQTNKLEDYQQNCLANSNAVHATSGAFAELSANVKRLLGLSTKKAFYCQHSKRLKTKNLKEIITYERI